MVLKLDMSKAYDRVKQVYLEDIMRRMSFYNTWIDLIMVYVKIVSYLILVNGEPQGIIHPSRGMRQGDPLSPFLFLLCIEGPHELITKAMVDGELKGFSTCRRGLKLIHLFFSDGNMLFCRGNSEECDNILNSEEEKTTLFSPPSKSTPLAAKDTIKGLPGE